MKSLGLVLVLVLAAAAASAQELAPTRPAAFHVSLDREQHPVAGRLIGQVHNDSPLWVTDVHLEIRALDTEGRDVGRTSGWALGDIAPGGQSSFEFPAMPGAASYQIRVISYDVVAGPGAGG
jgi:hypothetical protein